MDIVERGRQQRKVGEVLDKLIRDHNASALHGIHSSPLEDVMDITGLAEQVCKEDVGGDATLVGEQVKVLLEEQSVNKAIPVGEKPFKPIQEVGFEIKTVTKFENESPQCGLSVGVIKSEKVLGTMRILLCREESQCAPQAALSKLDSVETNSNEVSCAPLDIVRLDVDHELDVTEAPNVPRDLPRRAGGQSALAA